MPYSIELYFESAFEKRIFSLWRELQDVNLPVKFVALGIRPHLTLAVLEDCNESAVSQIVGSISRNFSKIEIDFPAICAIPSVSQMVFLLPIVNKTLEAIRERLISSLLELENYPLKHYLQHSWLPHCTISKELTPDQSKETMSICQDSDIYGEAEAIEIGFVEFKPRREILVETLQ